MIKIWWFLWVAFLVGAKQTIKEKAIEADKHIHFIKPSDIQSTKDTWLIFFAVKWCGYCTRLTPKWLALQLNVTKSPFKGFHMAKIDCTDNEPSCLSHGIDGYPTIYL
jgi:hypothetical protein